MAYYHTTIVCRQSYYCLEWQRFMGCFENQMVVSDKLDK